MKIMISEKYYCKVIKTNKLLFFELCSLCIRMCFCWVPHFQNRSINKEKKVWMAFLLTIKHINKIRIFQILLPATVQLIVREVRDNKMQLLSKGCFFFNIMSHLGCREIYYYLHTTKTASNSLLTYLRTVWRIGSMNAVVYRCAQRRILTQCKSFRVNRDRLGRSAHWLVNALTELRKTLATPYIEPKN